MIRDDIISYEEPCGCVAHKLSSEPIIHFGLSFMCRVHRKMMVGDSLALERYMESFVDIAIREISRELHNKRT